MSAAKDHPTHADIAITWRFALRLGLVVGWLSATGFWALAHYFGGLWNG